jgi:hypothetical protein
MTGVYSAANEQAVAMFLDKKIGYFDMFKVLGLLPVPWVEPAEHHDGNRPTDPLRPTKVGRGGALGVWR